MNLDKLYSFKIYGGIFFIEIKIYSVLSSGVFKKNHTRCHELPLWLGDDTMQ